MKLFFKSFLILILSTVILFSCGNSKIGGTWKGYELGGRIPPSSWYINIDGERINAIHSMMSGENENYNGTINQVNIDGDITTYKVSLALGGDLGSINYNLKLANNKAKYFGLPDNSSIEKFQVVMRANNNNGGTIYLEKKF